MHGRTPDFIRGYDIMLIECLCPYQVIIMKNGLIRAEADREINIIASGNALGRLFDMFFPLPSLPALSRAALAIEVAFGQDYGYVVVVGLVG